MIFMSNQLATMLEPIPARRLALQVTMAALGRFIINTSRRFVYPFAPALSRGLGVPLTSVTSLIAINQFTGILSPVFGPLSDRWGYKLMMMAGLSLLAVGMLAGGFLPFYGMVLVALFLAGLAKSVYDPALQAYIGERVPFQRRGLVVGLAELSWAGATLIGIPLAGLLIDRLGWQAPFFVLGGLGLLSITMLGLILPTDRHRRGAAGPTNFGQVWRRLRQERAALGMMGFSFFSSMANDNLFVVYGAWLEDYFALGLVALGTATIAIGFAELTGETLTATIADRLGLKRAIFMGLVLTTLSYLLLPMIGQTLLPALAGLFIIFLSFEFTVVTGFSLATEILPETRASMMSSSVAASGLGRVIGALIGGSVWLGGGLLATGLVSAALSAAALACFGWGVRHWRV
jgi:predicted MFS family arabinose efflux permease